MRILELYLPAFGHFRNTALDLSGGERGLHVVYGGNEMGKSTLLRALKAFFYGIPERTTDSFLHAPADLRIGARILGEDGEEVAFLRRKGRKNTLLDLDGRAVPESSLERHLGGVGPELFTRLFGLDHDELVRGGQDILEGGGELGETLFAASLGGAGLRQILRELESECGALFNPRGKIQPINVSIREYREARKETRQASLSHADYTQLQRDLDDARGEAERLRVDQGRLRGQLRRWERILAALPSLSRRQSALRELEELGSTLRLREQFGDEMREAMADFHRGSESESLHSEEVMHLEADLEHLDIPVDLLEQSTLIEMFHRDLGTYLKEKEDMGPLRKEMDRLRREAGKLLRNLRPDISLDAIEQLRLDQERIEAIHRQARVQKELQAGIESQVKELEELEIELAELRARAGDDAERPPAGELRERLEMVPNDLEDRLSVLRADLETSEAEIGDLLHRNRLHEGGLDDFVGLVVPLAETVDRYHEVLEQLDRSISEESRERERIAAEGAEALLALEELRGKGSIPSEAELIRGRAERDELWSRIRDAWMERRTDDVDDLAGRYEASVRSSDEMADRLRREANRAARYASLTSRRDQSERLLREIDDRLALRRVERETIVRRWEGEWHLDQPPLSPAEMRGWLRERERLLGMHARIRGQREELEALERSVQRHREDLIRLLSRSGDGDLDPEWTLADLVARGRALAGSLEESERRRDDLLSRRRVLEERRGRLQRQLREGRARLAGEEEHWKRLLEGLPVDADGSADRVVDILGQLGQILSGVDRATDCEGRVEAMTENRREFASRVESFLASHASDLSSLPVEEAVLKLRARWNQAQKDDVQRESWSRERDAARDRCRKASEIRQRAEATLRRLCKEAECESPQALEEAEARSRQRRELEVTVKSLDERLIDAAGGQELEVFLRELETVDADRLAGDLERWGGELDDLEEELERCHQRIGSAREALDRMEEEAGASEPAERAEAVLARMRDEVERYLRLRMASRVLGLEIDRYRRENQGPVLERAGQLFQSLTRGSFVDIALDFDAGDRPVITGVRTGGERVRVEGLSDGTRDQLYLSLRLASLERQLDAHTPLPLVVDDLLVQFDDPRAEATLQQLAELSRRTQVLLFTHHAHLRDLARRTVDPNVLQVPNFMHLEEVCGKIGK